MYVRFVVYCYRSFENECLALMEAASPDLEKQGFLAVVFVYREYSVQQVFASYKDFASFKSLYLKGIRIQKKAYLK
ncbi:hypothetical protein ACFFLS_25635 [Flavobacterium procerum]|uniref:ABM domain-containing protein n=1 Tax=Flavobacterium procerum TaxID=1455569 RepID=A0ABV6C0E0_9FLAO